MLYTGYAGSIWTTVFQTLAVYNQQLSAFTTAAAGTSGTVTSTQLAQSSQATFETLRNGAEAINAFALMQAWQSDLNGLQQIQALPLSVPTLSETYFNNRVTAYEVAIQALSPLVVYAPYASPDSIVDGNASVPSTGLLEFYEGFEYETAPAGLTNANFINRAYRAAQAFLDVANAIVVFQGATVTQLYDVAYRQYLTAQFTAQLLDSLATPPVYGFETSSPSTVPDWNQLVALPSMGLVADILNGASFTQQLQQQAVLRNTMLTFATKIAYLMLSLRKPQTGQISLTTLRNNETLMDVAARTTGNFENWQEIAALNGLSPPYVGAVSSSGVAGWGSQLVLPVPGTALSSTGSTPSYAANFLGIDLYVGPINGVMPPWNGDFQTIVGYANLAWALGRRLQTTQGSLIYHPAYGSRIPPEVGAVQTTQTAGHVTAYGKSALLSDPRVASVPSATTSIQANSLVAFNATVKPSGFETQNVTLNEVISNLP